ncbi:autotransporter domain-containing protein [Helicobacter sp.]|uniref:autotransporter family protein n=1 Tax=Helicobacter sp. TaxID=218 RepID=UPI0025C56DF8|nr:autotransporter domain-containing protein [Helicobacter sp.]
MKISLIASRCLVGSMALSLSALSLYATDVTTKSEFETNFIKQEGTNNYKNKNNDATLAIKLPTTEAVKVQALLGANGRIIVDNAANEITLGAADTDIFGSTLQMIDDPNNKFYGFDLTSTHANGITNGGALNVGKDSTITGNFTNNNALNILGSKLDITGDFTQASGTELGIAQGALNIKGAVNMQGDVGLQSGKINVTGSYTEGGATDYYFYNFYNLNSLISVRKAGGDTPPANDGQISLNASSTFTIDTLERALADDLNLMIAEGGFALASLGTQDATSKLWGTNLTENNPTVRFVANAARFLDNPSLLAGIEVEDLMFYQEAQTGGTPGTERSYTLYISEDKKTLFVKVEAAGGLAADTTKNATQAEIITALNTAIESQIAADKAAIGTSSSDTGTAREAIANVKTAESDKVTAATAAITAADTAITTQQGILDNSASTDAQKVAAQTALTDAQAEKSKQEAIKAQAEANIAKLDEAETQLADKFTALTISTAATDAEKLQENLATLVGDNYAGIAQQALIVTTNKNENKLLMALATDSGDLKATSVSLENAGNLSEAYGILSSFAGSSVNVNEALNVITNRNFFKNTRENAKSASTLANASTSALSGINIANEMSISNRVAAYNNPYGARLANIGSDATGNYYDTYKASVWANAFGGASIIDGDSGGLYGVTLGVDGNVTDNLLLGAYFTYANSTLKDNALKQEADNYQIGLYSLVKFAETWELGLKGYGQWGSTDQESRNIAGLNTADFTKKFFGLSGSLGRVFDLSNGNFLKPFAGLNYYYSFTPSYTEKGTILAQHVQSSTNNSVSIDVGLEYRKYFGSSSYLYVVPKVEQYIVNNGDDFVAKFVGSNTNFSIDGDDKKRTYGQILLGGNIELTQDWVLNVGLGAKQILAGKFESKNETYLNGNAGLKYRF